jgi:PAS domain-containing protein
MTQDQRTATAAGSLPWVITDASGDVVQASVSAVALFNVSLRGLLRRSLYPFFDTDREHWRVTAAHSLAGVPIEREATMRPRERRPITVSVKLTREADTPISDLVWVFELLRIAPRRYGRNSRMSRSATSADGVSD